MSAAMLTAIGNTLAQAERKPLRFADEASASFWRQSLAACGLVMDEFETFDAAARWISGR